MGSTDIVTTVVKLIEPSRLSASVISVPRSASGRDTELKLLRSSATIPSHSWGYSKFGSECAPYVINGSLQGRHLSIILSPSLEVAHTPGAMFN